MNPYMTPLPYYGGLGQAQQGMQQGGPYGGPQPNGNMMQHAGPFQGGQWWNQQHQPPQQQQPRLAPPVAPQQPGAAGGMAAAGMGMMYPGAGGQGGVPGMMGMNPQIIQQLMAKNLAAYKAKQQQQPPGAPPGAPGYTTGGGGNNVTLPQQTQQAPMWGSSGAVPYTDPNSNPWGGNGTY